MSAAHREGLNPEQLAAVRHTRGPLLVLAGAGTGKTRVVTARIAELLEQGARSREILAVTFTNKAAREMKERVRTVLRGRDLEGMIISTFHSFGLRLLREQQRESGSPPLEIADAADQMEITADALRECGIRREFVHPRFARFTISLWKNAAVLPETALAEASDEETEGAARAYERYEDLLARRRLVDFDDLILKPLALLETDLAFRQRQQERFRLLLVDEYQDTNACQARILKHLAGSQRNVCVVGDDDQSIYGWRGADAERILAFKKDFPGATTVALEQNYRSTGAILEAANALITNNSRRQKKKLWSAAGAGTKPQLYRAEDDKDEMDFVASRIQKLLRTGRKFEDLAVLFRANSQCRPLELALRERQIPYQIVGTRSFFDRREVRDLLGYLRLIANPLDDSAFLRVVNTPARGIGRGTVEKASGAAAEARTGLLEGLRKEQDNLSGAAREGTKSFLALLDSVQQVLKDKGTGAALETLLAETGYRHHLKMVTEDARELAERDQVVDDLLEMARGHGMAGLGAFLDSLALGDDDVRKPKDEKPRGVTLLTMHAAKGLEFPVVFLIGLEEGLLPHGRTVAEEEDALEDNPGRATNAIEEERRLFYVGITRARQTLFLSWAATRARRGRSELRDPSRFLAEVGDELVEPVADDRSEPLDSAGAKSWADSIRQRLKGGAS